MKIFKLTEKRKINNSNQSRKGFNVKNMHKVKNMLNRALVVLLTVAMLVSVFPAAVFAAEGSADEYKISNDYLWFSYNKKTGGFAIETAEGNPQKIMDNDMPLLYSEDKEGSNGTSFISVRIDGDDYVFGQDYSFFEIASGTGDILIKENGRLMEIPWTIDGVTVTLKAALDSNTESDTTGNVGLSFEVKNNTEKEKEVSIRLLLDTALGNRIDAPYFVVDDKEKATLTETEFSERDGCEAVPQQIRSVDSLTNPTRLSYIIMKGWNTGITPNKVILGHWANMANTRYDYTADEFCDFTNYSNNYRSPDSAAAVYWEGNKVAPNGSFTGEVLYGVGNFSNPTDVPLGINITADRVELDSDSKSYKNDGMINVKVELDNTVDDATELSKVLVNLKIDDDKFEVADGTVKSSYDSLGKEIKTLNYTLKAKPQNDLCAGTIYVAVSGTRTLENGDVESFETAAERSLVLPSVGSVSEIQLGKVNPEIVYTDGEKAVTISGKMKALSSFLANDVDVRLVLKHTTSDHEVEINKDKITFLDEEYDVLTFTTSETLTVGEYKIIFRINDPVIKQNLNCDEITASQTLQVSADSRYKLKSYGMIALVRYSKDDDDHVYDFYTFGNEKEFLKFYNGELSAKGQLTGQKIKFDFGKDEDGILDYEILLTVRGNLQEMKTDSGEIFWQAEKENGDIIINNMLKYEGDKPLKVYRKNKDELRVEGDGQLKVINSITVWRSGWYISAINDDAAYTLEPERYTEAGGDENEQMTLAFSGAASMIQTIGGFAVDLKYGMLSSQWYDDSDGMVTYGIGFGGSISIPIKAKSDKSDSNASDSGGEGESGSGSLGSGSQTGSGSSGTEDSGSSGGSSGTDARDIMNEREEMYEAIKNAFGPQIAYEFVTGELDIDLGDYTGSGSGSEGSGSGSSEGSGSGTGSSGTTSSTASNPVNAAEVSSLGDKILQDDDDLPEGQLSAEVNNVLFGEKGSNKNGTVTVDGTGFIGIDAEFSLALPEDVLGSFVSNAPGLFANVTINTIENVYEINAGLSLKVIECEGVLAFKQVSVKNKDVILPDKIEFYIRDGLKVPLAPPVLYMTGLGGGINGLADTIGGEFSELPPLTILLYTKLEAIGLMEGEFNAKISLSGLTLSGDMKIRNMDDVMELDAEINARWVEPWELSLCGNVTIIDGLIKGGITVTIADDYFYGYVFATICIPSSIPLVGGKELSKIEAAVSHEFIGANIKIIGIKFGVIYYWGDKVSFGKNIDLSAPSKDDESDENGGTEGYSLNGIGQDYSHAEAVGYYGTNIYALNSESSAPIMLNDITASKTFKIGNVPDSSALLLEIPFTGSEPSESDVELWTQNDTKIELVKDDENGNMLVQDIDGNKYIYITVTDKSLIKSGETWTFKYNSTMLDVSDIKVNGVDDIPEINEDSATISGNGYKAEIGWKIDGAKSGDTGTVDVYLNTDKDILNKISNETINDSLGTSVYHKENVDLTATGKADVTLPDTLEDGNYYAVVVLTTDNGISLALSKTAAEFTNPKLPKSVEKIKIYYGGNGGIFVEVTDADDPDYTHYLAEVVDKNGNTVENSLNQFEMGSNFTIGREALLKEGEEYNVRIKTLREEYKQAQSSNGSAEGAYTTHYYYGSGYKTAETPITMPTPNTPKLKSVNVNFDTSADDININVKDVVIEYEFENDVFVEMDLNDSKVYAFGVDPDPNEKSTYFKKNWKFVLDDLDDGDYVVDFTAFSDNKDYITGSSITDVENATLGFTVDTSAPVLSLAQNSVTRMNGNEELTVVFGANTVTADENGVYTIEGITESTSLIEFDGVVITAETEGVEIANNGSFTITKTLPDGKNYTEHRITVTDKAGNVSETNVWVVSKSGFSYDELKIYLDGKEVKKDSDGVKKVTLKNAQKADLTVYGVLSSGSKAVKLDDDTILWNIMYAKNLLDMDDGSITALSPGETAVKAKLNTSDITSGGVTYTDGLSDYVVLEIEYNSKSDLKDKITEAEEILNTATDVSENKKAQLQSAIDKAKKILNSGNASEEDYTQAVTDLNNAIESFKQPESSDDGGSGSSGGSGGHGGVGGLYTRYSVTVEPAEHGKVEVSQDKVYRGNSLTVTATPDEGYVVANMLINGKSVGRKQVYTLNSVTDNITVKVIFAEKTELPFTDVAETDWFYAYVKDAYDFGYMKGTSETEFEPESLLTRAMFVTVLHRIEGEPQGGENVFWDVHENEYYKEAVSWANSNGIVTGTETNRFSPDENITREQMAAILYRYAKYKKMDLTATESTNILSYADYDSISEYAISAMQYTAGVGLIKGKTDSTLNPSDNATRAEAATVFVRFSEMM